MENVLAQLNRQPQVALVQLWQQLHQQHPRFQHAEYTARQQPQQHQCAQTAVQRFLDNGQLYDVGLVQQHPLAVLQALDEHLGTTQPVQAQGITPAQQVKLGRQTFLVHRRLTNRQTQAAHRQQSGHLHAWLQYHWIIPAQLHGFQLHIRAASAVTARRLRACQQREVLSVYAAGFDDRVQLVAQPNHPGYLAIDVDDTDVRWTSVEHALNEAVAQQADLFLLPELTLTPALQEKLLQTLLALPDHPFALIQPGSFHEQDDQGDWWNVARLYDADGQVLLEHRKLTTFSTRDHVEAHRTGDSIQLLDTPLGLLAMPICLDFCEEGHPFSSLWQELGINWYIIPAFGDDRSVRAHQRRAKNLANAWNALSILTNQDPQGRFKTADAERTYGFVRHGSVETPLYPAPLVSIPLV